MPGAAARTAARSRTITGVTVAALGFDLRVLDMRTRMPFRYGIASMTALPHLFVRVEAAVGGRTQVGLASEGLAPKWFTKDPSTTFRADLADMLRVIRHACGVAAAAGGAPTVFDLWQRVHAAQTRWAAGEGYPPLLAGLGTSLVERALIDACCRAAGTTFGHALRDGSLGLRLGDVHAELAGAAPADLLPAQPLRSVVARHTVGLADPLTDAGVPPGERLDDGLPQSLAACIRAYGLTHFKVKVFGDPNQDRDRLRGVAAVLAAEAPPAHAFTLDGNEQFRAAGAFRAYWEQLLAEPALTGLWRRLLFVEQPLHRDVALSEETGAALRAWPDRPPTIIDEADGEIGSLPRALALGYAGTSYKSCKGVFRGIANACLLAARGRREPDRRFILSGEDLANVGPVALLQDLAAMATLGVEHVERNGHHYFAGLSMLPAPGQAQVLRDHGDLYRRHPAGYPVIDVRAGRIAVGSVVDAPFGTRFLLDTAGFTSLESWRFESLGVEE